MSPHNSQPDDPEKSDLSPIILHLAISLVWIVLMGLIWINTAGNNISAADVGAFLSGSSAPLAFYWLVVGYFLQRQELALQRRELALNREQLAAQAIELNRQANSTAELVKFQSNQSANEQLNDKMQALPQRVFKLVSAYRPFHQIGPRRSNGDHKITFAQNVPHEPDALRVRDFSQHMKTVSARWSTQYETEFGPLRTCCERRDATAVVVLENEFRALEKWWTDCKALANAVGNQALEAKGEEYGIEQLLAATTAILAKP